MIRKQVYIEKRQDRLLKQRAKALRTTEAELIRRGLDRTLIEAGTESRKDSWQSALDLMQRRKRMRGARRTWHREELYDRG